MYWFQQQQNQTCYNIVYWSWFKHKERLLTSMNKFAWNWNNQIHIQLLNQITISGLIVSIYTTSLDINVKSTSHFKIYFVPYLYCNSHLLFEGWWKLPGCPNPPFKGCSMKWFLSSTCWRLVFVYVFTAMIKYVYNIIAFMLNTVP